MPDDGPPPTEVVLSLGLALLVLLTHDVGYLTRQSFWNDESWVAVTTRFPLSDLRAVTSSTPIGWSLLLRLVTRGADETPRLLPLAFAGAAVVTAYWFGRGLGWRRRDVAVGAGGLTALAVLVAPAMLVRDDLKQYTADAFAALLALTLTSRLERGWSRRGLAALSVSVWGGMLVSHTVAFVGVAAFGAVCVVQLARREWRRLVEALLVATGTAVLMAVVYVAFDAQAVSHTGLTEFWRHYYLPLDRGVGTSARFVVRRLGALPVSVGVGPWWSAFPLVVAGSVTLLRLGRPATALTALTLWPLLLAASAAKAYPFLDLRTSTFLFVVTAAVEAVGVAGLCTLVRPRLRGTLAAALATVAVAGLATQAQPYLRSHPIPDEDIGPQTRYVVAHAAPDDVILVSPAGNWGFAYYWPTGHPSRRPGPVIQQYLAYFPDQPRIVLALARTVPAVDAALAQALERAPHRAGAHLWLVRLRQTGTESEALARGLRRNGLVATPLVGLGLAVVTLP